MSQRRSTTPLFELLDLNKPNEPGHRSSGKAGTGPGVGPASGQSPPQAPGQSSGQIAPGAGSPAMSAGSATPAASSPRPAVLTRPVQVRPPGTGSVGGAGPETASSPPAKAVVSVGEEEPSSWARIPKPEEPRPLLSQGLGRPAIVGRLLVLPVPFALIALGILIALGAGIWGIAWSLGADQAREQERARAAAMGSSGGILDPIARNPSGGAVPPESDGMSGQSQPRQTQPPQPVPQPPQQQQQPRTQPTPPPPAAIAAAADPRQEGYNYLRLANLNQAQAQSAVDRLRLGGLEAFAVPLESGARRGNNPPRYAVYLAQGFPGNQFSASRRERERLEQAVLRVGQAWAQEGGPTDFRSPFWDKYAP